MDADTKARLLADTRADLLKRQLSNSENYDKAILSLSTAFLGFSLAFLKDMLPLRAEWIGLLYGSWVTFGAAVLSTIISFYMSQRGIDAQLRKAEDYYLRDDQTALAKHWTAKATDWVNNASGAFFIIGISLTIAFVIVNFHRRVEMTSDKKPARVSVGDGASIPRMQEVPLKKGAPIPNLQPMPQSQAPQNQPTPQSNPAPRVPIPLGAPIPNLQPVPNSQTAQSRPAAPSNTALPPASTTPSGGNKK
jgi:hypothetical protein